MTKDVDKMTPEELEQERRRTIEMLHPELKREMEACARDMGMSWDEFLRHLRLVCEGEIAARDGHGWGYYVSVGENEAYKKYDWDKIWVGYEVITGEKVPPSQWGNPGSGFSCSC